MWGFFDMKQKHDLTQFSIVSHLTTTRSSVCIVLKCTYESSFGLEGGWRHLARGELKGGILSLKIGTLDLEKVQSETNVFYKVGRVSC